MPKNKVNDPITDQEIAFARLILSGGMTDRQAAEAAGLKPDSAAYVKSKPHVRAYMVEHRAAVQQQLVQQDADLSRGAAERAVEQAVEEQHRLKLDREKALDRLWEIAYLSPEVTRGSITGQVKALTIIVAMQNLIPDRRALSSQKNSPAAPVPQMEAAMGRRDQQNTAAQEAPLSPDPNRSTFASRRTPSEAPKLRVPLFSSIPDLGVPFPVKNPFVHPVELKIGKKA